MIFNNTVICFHRICNSLWIENVIKIIKRYYRIISLRDLEKYYYYGQRGMRMCHLTFDDGHISFYEHVYPVIKKMNIPVSIYVSPKVVINSSNFWFQEIKGYDEFLMKEIIAKSENISYRQIENIPLHSILKCFKIEKIYEYIYKYKGINRVENKKPENMNLAQLLEVHKSGLVDIGAHTLTHPILKNESDEVALNEIKGSIDQLSDMINKKIISFVYPNGYEELDFGIREINIVKKCGIKLAFSTRLDTFHIDHNPLAIPRNHIEYSNQFYITLKMMMGKRWKHLKNIIVNYDDSNRKKLIDIIN